MVIIYLKNHDNYSPAQPSRLTLIPFWYKVHHQYEKKKKHNIPPA